MFLAVCSHLPRLLEESGDRAQRQSKASSGACRKSRQSSTTSMRASSHVPPELHAGEPDVATSDLALVHLMRNIEGGVRVASIPEAHRLAAHVDGFTEQSAYNS